MKRTILAKPSLLIITVLLASHWLTSCKKQTTELATPVANEEIASAKTGGNPNTLHAVSLRVTSSDAAGNNITSDGKGDYIDGIDLVQAVIDQYGTVALNTLNSNSPKTVAKRWVVYNFNNPVDPNNAYRPAPDNLHNYHFSTGSSRYGTNPFIPLQNLSLNASECIYMGNSVSNSTITWRVSFHKGNENTPTSPAAFAVVTRINATQWTIAPIGSCSPNSNVAALRNDDGSILYGYYNMPFFFTLTKL